MYPPVEVPRAYRWGMTVDVDRCTGCQACVVACVAGEQCPGGGQGAGGLRPRPALAAPGALGGGQAASTRRTSSCPCSASTARSRRASRCARSTRRITRSEGLNAQVYNRCVGTRYCGNNCPYHVRRFNWFNYTWPSPLDVQLNPDVTVRQLGVMEKCTMCVQRIIDGQGRRPRRGAAGEGRRDQDRVPADVPHPGHHLRQPEGREARR